MHRGKEDYGLFRSYNKDIPNRHHKLYTDVIYAVSRYCYLNVH